MVNHVSDQSGIVLRTLHILRPSIARFGWTHAMLISSNFAVPGYNFWKIPGASYPSSRFACERYLFRLESLFPSAFEATSIAAFAAGLADWLADPEGLVQTYQQYWPNQNPLSSP